MFSTAETFAPRFATIATMQYNHIYGQYGEKTGCFLWQQGPMIGELSKAMDDRS